VLLFAANDYLGATVDVSSHHSYPDHRLILLVCTALYDADKLAHEEAVLNGGVRNQLLGTVALLTPPPSLSCIGMVCQIQKQA
jgi:hypothetical protein